MGDRQPAAKPGRRRPAALHSPLEKGELSTQPRGTSRGIKDDTGDGEGEQEEWSEGEKEYCFAKIKENKEFDFVLSHTGPSAGIALTDDFFCNEENLKQLQKDSNVVFNDKIDSIISYKKWFFGHWHSDWGYEHYNNSKYVPLYHQGIII